jgi:hypothetical protein
MEQQYIVKERRYYESALSVRSRMRFPYAPAPIDEAIQNLEWQRNFCANVLHASCDLWLEPVRGDAYVIEAYIDGEWVAEEYFEDYQDAVYHYERCLEYSGDYRFLHADGSEVEETTADDAYEAYRDHVRAESNILARRARTW